MDSEDSVFHTSCKSWKPYVQCIKTLSGDCSCATMRLFLCNHGTWSGYMLHSCERSRCHTLQLCLSQSHDRLYMFHFGSLVPAPVQLCKGESVTLTRNVFHRHSTRSRGIRFMRVCCVCPATLDLFTCTRSVTKCGNASGFLNNLFTGFSYVQEYAAYYFTNVVYTMS